MHAVVKNKITIFHLLNRFDIIGGLENGVINLVNQLLPGRFRHVICSLTSLGDIAERVRAENVIYYQLNKSDGNDLRIVFKIYRILKKEYVDVVHLRNWVTMVEGYIAAKMAGITRIIYSEHGRHFEDLDNKKRAATWIKKFIFKDVDVLLSVSDVLGREMKNRYQIKRPITVIHNGVDREKFKPKSTIEIRKKYGWSECDVIIGSVSRIDKGKNYEQLIIDFLSKRGESRLIIVGDGPEEGMVKQLVADQDKEGRVLLLGNREDVPDLLNCFNVFAFPSLSEGLSNVVLEAMSCGLPIVAYDAGGNRELIIDQKGGYLIKLGNNIKFIDAIEQIIENKNNQEIMGWFNRNKILKEFSLDNMVDSYSSIYSVET